jgi:hypothetical protein
VFHFFLTRKFLVMALALLLCASTHARSEGGQIHITLLKTKHANDARGALFYDSRRYRLAVKGIGLTAGEIERIDLMGHVLNLRNVEDILGTYGAADSGTTVISGLNKVKLRNADGAILELHATKNAVPEIDLAGMVLESRGWSGKAKGDSRGSR